VTYSEIILVVGIILVSVFGCSVQNDAQEESQTGKKEVPVITFKNLTPPFKDYDYFQGFKKYGFQINATSFSLINAWWLAEVSILVYADEEFVRSQLKRAGLPEGNFSMGEARSAMWPITINSPLSHSGAAKSGKKEKNSI
jgi:hypothetical protein